MIDRGPFLDLSFPGPFAFSGLGGSQDVGLPPPNLPSCTVVTPAEKQSAARARLLNLDGVISERIVGLTPVI